MADRPLEPPNWLYWMDKTSNDQLEWVVKYLRKKGTEVLYKDAPGIFPALESVFANWIDTAESREFMRRMRLAWSQRKFRKGSSTHKPCNFLLTRKAASDLKSMSRRYGEPMNHIVDRLIKDDSYYRKIDQQKRKDDVERAQKDTLAKAIAQLGVAAEREKLIQLENERDRLKGVVTEILARNKDLQREVIKLNLKTEEDLSVDKDLEEKHNDLIEGRLHRVLRKERSKNQHWYVDEEVTSETPVTDLEGAHSEAVKPVPQHLKKLIEGLPADFLDKCCEVDPDGELDEHQLAKCVETIRKQDMMHATDAPLTEEQLGRVLQCYNSKVVAG